MQTIYFVICNAGDGSNYLQWFKTKEAVEYVRQLADSGDERYASGDGLQLSELKFPNQFNIDKWADYNIICFNDADILLNEDPSDEDASDEETLSKYEY